MLVTRCTRARRDAVGNVRAMSQERNLSTGQSVDQTMRRQSHVIEVRRLFKVERDSIGKETV